MRHARDGDLDRIEPLLVRLRELGVLKEKKRGAFYFKSRGFVHFHEDPAGMFADLRCIEPRENTRMKVDTLAEQDTLMDGAREILRALQPPARAARRESRRIFGRA